MPLVPEPYDSMTICKLSRRAGDSITTSDYLKVTSCKFLQNLNIPEHREQLTENEKDDLDRRADTLQKHSVQSYVDEVSESTWEADVRSDVFGKVRDDQRLRMLVQPSSDYVLQTDSPTVISSLTNS